jgi:peptide/nickel transport system substrate-binding protein
MVLNRNQIISYIVLLSILISGCRGEDYQALEFLSDSESKETPITTYEPSVERVLSICLGDEPSSLFIYGDLSKTAAIVRQAIYDGPIDEVNFQLSSPLLTQIPSLENGLVSMTPVGVLPGEWIVDADGNPTILASGVVYKPSGCLGEDCFEVFLDQASITLDQIEIRFPLKDGITWSDGTPLSVEDSLFSYQLAESIYGISSGPGKMRFVSDYQVLNENTLRWIGLPGYTNVISYGEYFFSPLPKHDLDDLSWEDLIVSEKLNDKPLGWGPYRISEWVLGDHITLIKNDNYHRSGEGLPAYDALVFRFVTNGEEALAAFYAGECQVAANADGLIDFLPTLIDAAEEGNLHLGFIEGTAWEQISFGVNSLDPRRTALQDPRLRQAITMCVNREGIKTLRSDVGEVVDGFFFPEDPRIELNELSYPYRPGAGNALLEEIGWIDHDGDPTTPRIAKDIEKLVDDTELRLGFLAPGEGDVPLTVSRIQEDLAGCGIVLDIQMMPASELLAPGPNGPVFGRQFDMALFAWAVGPYQRCQLFLADEIPGNYPEYHKGWGGVNATGYNNYDYDSLCRELMMNPPDYEGVDFARERISELFIKDLPVLPLFFRRDLVISTPDLGLSATDYSPLFWDIEDIK